MTADDLVGPLLRAHAAGRGVPVPDVGPPDVWAALVSAGDPAPGLTFAAAVPVSVVGGPLLTLLANSADVGELLERLVRFHPLFGSEALDVATVAGVRRVRLRSPDGGPAHPDTVDACFALLGRLLGELTRGGVRPDVVRLRRPAGDGPEPARRADAFGAGRVVHGAAEDVLEVGAGACAVRLPGADPELARLVEPYADRRVAERGRRRAAQVTRLLAAAAAAPPPVDVVARSLAVGVRTLQEQLRAEGTTYSALVEEVRRERVLALLADPDVLLTTVAARVGFATPAALTRAVRRWTGATPSGYRRSVSGR